MITIHVGSIADTKPLEVESLHSGKMVLVWVEVVNYSARIDL